jgi:CheY-like chemotaxis protein
VYKKILVVEDEAVFRKIIARNLSAHGCAVLEAETVEEAVERLSWNPDLILLDINLPDRSGWQVLRHLREIGREIPVVIVSAVRVSPERLAEFRPLAYLPKPFPLDALLRIVNGEANDEDQSFITATSQQQQEGLIG